MTTMTSTAPPSKTSSTRRPWPTSLALTSSMSTSQPITKTACLPSFCASTKLGAHPTPTFCATPKSSSKPSSTMHLPWAPTKSPRATTPGCATTRKAACTSCSRAWTPAKTKAIFCTGSHRGSCRKPCSPWARLKSPRCGASPTRRACPTPAKKTQPAFASLASGRSGSS